MMVDMKTNESVIDRIIRIVLAVVFGIVAYKTTGAVSVLMWVLTVIAGLTGIVGFCPLYRVFGISTCKVK
ncbi:membrane protein [Corynebacterium lactis RW2-5]|uniref:Membrane protein n=2 Tax=Corynebacterium lactis TaxID=1231000 RepID=A0A0K2GZE0_9CORY|nr:membrane protein [Corynebacterium lactis RW2-5]